MSGFLFAFLAVALAATGARDQMLVAGLAARNGQKLGLLVVAIASSMLAAAAIAWAAQAILPLLAPAARRLFAAIALGLAGAELLLVRPKAPPEEPTQSLGATAIVLFAQELTDGARFLIAGMAVATGAPLAAGLGGAAAGAVAVTAAWLGADDWLRLPLRPVRIAAGAVLLLIAAWLALVALDH